MKSTMNKTFGEMKKLLSLLIVLSLVLLSACANSKPQYKTRKGKKKLKHYNELQYNKH